MKYEYTNDAALSEFVRDGFCIYRDVFDSDLIAKCRKFVLDRLAHLKNRHSTRDINGWSVAIMDELERSPLYDELIHSPKLLHICQMLVGPDIAWFGYDGLFINYPTDTDPVTVKGLHTDVWTGTGVNTVYATILFTDVDEYNGLTVCPGSHLQGLMPVRNRAIDPNCGFECEQVNLVELRAGDLKIWHPLLIHATTGHSNKNIRVSLVSRFTSPLTEMTSQEKAFGYRTLKVGPLNQILRLVGNDHLLPFRTQGGYVGVDRRMSGIYNFSPYKDAPDYRSDLRNLK